MKLSSILLAVGVASTASAIGIDGLIAKLPLCALNCFQHIVPHVCPGGILDFGCQCQPANKNKLTKLLSPCLLDHCSQHTGLVVNGVANEICEKWFETHPGGPPPAPSTTVYPSNSSPTGFNAAPRATAGPLAAVAAAAVAFAL